MTVLPCHAVDSLSVELGAGNKTQVLRAGMQWNWRSAWDIGDNARLSGFWDLNLARWHGQQYRDQDGADQNLSAIGISGALRLSTKEDSGPYFETGLGPHLLSDLYDNNRRQLSTHFQFGSHLALGYVFSNKTDLALRFQHYSNAGIKQPNDGVNFLILRIAWPL